MGSEGRLWEILESFWWAWGRELPGGGFSSFWDWVFDAVARKPDERRRRREEKKAWGADERRRRLEEQVRGEEAWPSSLGELRYGHFLVSHFFCYFAQFAVEFPALSCWLKVGIEDHMLFLTSKVLWWCSNAFIPFFIWFGSILSCYLQSCYPLILERPLYLSHSVFF